MVDLDDGGEVQWGGIDCVMVAVLNWCAKGEGKHFCKSENKQKQYQVNYC
jgi:hypothetical protein